MELYNSEEEIYVIIMYKYQYHILVVELIFLCTDLCCPELYWRVSTVRIAAALTCVVLSCIGGYLLYELQQH